MKNIDELSKEYDRWLEKALIIVIGVIVISVLILKTNIIFVEDYNPEYYTDVAGWVQDVQSHVPDSERRHTFVATVHAGIADNVITTKEYRDIKVSFDDLKQSIALTSIHDDIKLMRAPNEFSLTTPRLASESTGE